MTEKDILIHGTAQRIKERHAFHIGECGDTAIDRNNMAAVLGVTPQRLSELLLGGIIEVVQLKPQMLFARTHTVACFNSYKQGLVKPLKLDEHWN
jgi:hypothetical protein